jgi:hypothetical protein
MKNFFKFKFHVQKRFKFSEERFLDSVIEKYEQKKLSPQEQIELEVKKKYLKNFYDLGIHGALCKTLVFFKFLKFERLKKMVSKNQQKFNL